jgi:hypothetical protein
LEVLEVPVDWLVMHHLVVEVTELLVLQVKLL